ncbi:MAG: RpiB/LacA/LacB family sugar-phosphate isomerase [Pelolinea sp.]|nr:RpiB/LacA/LacB family sugar-phosphate isomerase [Pelolinea sp.]
MRVAVGSDHGGFIIKDAVINAIKEAGHEPIDFGTMNQDSVDFPDYAEKVGKAIINGQADRGIAICGSGVGVCITANKIKGIYAGLISDVYSAHQGVEHDGMNVMCLAGLIIGPRLAKELVLSFLGAKEMDGERYKRRINKIKQIEKEFSK